MTRGMYTAKLNQNVVEMYNHKEPGYNIIGLYEISSIASDILWYHSIPHC
jgi:hypothetical protein